MSTILARRPDVDTALAALRHVDIIVNNAGGSRPMDIDAPEEHWVEAMTLNFDSHRQLTQKLLPNFLARKSGAILSVSGNLEPKGVNAAMVAKAGLVVCSKGLSEQIGKHGITANCVQPSPIYTAQIRRLCPDGERQKFAEREIAMRDFGEPQDVANPDTFMASPRASSITGIVLLADGRMRRYPALHGHGADDELALYTSDGDVMRDGREMQILAQDWHEWEMGDDARRKGATSISMILSMPSGTDPERLKEAALDFAREEFANRSWVVSLHVDRDHPHVHLTFARRDHDGRRFHPDRDDLFRYRQRFAGKLRERGIEANATPARARGIDPKHEPIAARKVREKGHVPRIDRSRADRAERLRERGLSDPVETVLARQHATVSAAT